MKRIFLSLLLLAGFVASTTKLQAQTSGSQHIEFKWYGFYCVVDYTHVSCFSNFSGQYKDPTTGTIVGPTDQYNLNGISAVAGWQFRKETALGLGFSYLNDPMKSFSQIPVFLEFRSHFMRSRITPFTSLQIGYTIPFGTKNVAEEYTRINEGGITFAINAGARFALKQKLGFNVFVGYQMIHLNSVERGFNEVAFSRMSELYDNIRFGLGVNF